VYSGVMILLTKYYIMGGGLVLTVRMWTFDSNTLLPAECLNGTSIKLRTNMFIGVLTQSRFIYGIVCSPVYVGLRVVLLCHMLAI